MGACYSGSPVSKERRACLEDLVHGVLPIRTTAAAVRRLPWDSEAGDLVVVTRGPCIAMLDRFLAGQLSADQLEDWADTLECCEDVGHEVEIVGEVIHALANPALHGAITAALVKDLRERCAAGGVEGETCRE
jgi:hypothetical protein